MAAATSQLDGASSSPKILLIGLTGVTGRSAIHGLLSAGVHPTQLVAISRNTSSETARSLTSSGLAVVAGDLDDEPSLLAAVRASGAARVYCHALGKDAATADPAEVARAKRLAAVCKGAGVEHLVYNSSGGRSCGYGITQMEQKHAIEDIFSASGVPFTALQATLFMEELWKRYTRPGILQGTFSFSVPSDVPIQLVAARDMGLAAALAMRDPGKYAGRAVELAGDELTPAQMAAVFAEVQGRPVVHKRAPAWPFFFLARDVWRISKFLTERGFKANVADVRSSFPGLLSFKDFLLLTGWADSNKTYDSGMLDFAKELPTASHGGAAAAVGAPATAAGAAAAAGHAAAEAVKAS